MERASLKNTALGSFALQSQGDPTALFTDRKIQKRKDTTYRNRAAIDLETKRPVLMAHQHGENFDVQNHEQRQDVALAILRCAVCNLLKSAKLSHLVQDEIID